MSRTSHHILLTRSKRLGLTVGPLIFFFAASASLPTARRFLLPLCDISFQLYGSASSAGSPKRTIMPLQLFHKRNAVAQVRDA